MAKTSSVEKNNRRRKLAAQYAAKRKALKDVIMDQDRPIEERFRAQLKGLSSGEMRRMVTGRPRAYYRKLKMSRIALRELGSLGAIPGLVKSSW